MRKPNGSSAAVAKSGGSVDHSHNDKLCPFCIPSDSPVRKDLVASHTPRQQQPTICGDHTSTPDTHPVFHIFLRDHVTATKQPKQRGVRRRVRPAALEQLELGTQSRSGGVGCRSLADGGESTATTGRRTASDVPTHSATTSCGS